MMKTRVVKDPNGFYYPQIEEGDKFLFIVEYGTYKDGKWLYPPRYETYESPIAGHHYTLESAQKVVDNFITSKVDVSTWAVVSIKEIKFIPE